MYSKIEIVAPSNAEAGATVDVEVRITSLVDYTIYATPILNVNGDIREGSYEAIVPEQTRSWYFQFTMPEQSVTVIAGSWCESYYFDWQLDDTAQKIIAAGGVVPNLLPLVMVGGLGVLGLGVAFALAGKKG